ncbi:hypothetical protein MC885_007235 [Smutsia gigantea]|nr:hypothetical protein MC885_007235 [Smutsia gigantea]
MKTHPGTSVCTVTRTHTHTHGNCGDCFLLQPESCKQTTMAGPDGHGGDWVLQPFSSKPPKSQPHIFSLFPRAHLLCLLMGVGASGKNSAPTVVTGIVGGSVTLALNISVGTEIEHVTWTCSQKALAFAEPKGLVILMDKNYKGRLNWSWRYLSINNLTLEDAGSYRAQINQDNSKVTMYEEFTLTIYEQLQKPQVTMKSVNMSENGTCNITLICSVDGMGKDVLYIWTLGDTHASESCGGSTLTISWMPCEPDLPYTCTARNPVSQSSSHPVHVQQFCTDPGASRGRSMGETVVGILGEAVKLPLEHPASHPIENVVWIFNTSIISHKREEAATADPLIKSKDPDKNTVWVSSQDYSLKIGQMAMEDAGPYHAYACSNASRVISTKHIVLLVYRRLQNPKVTWSHSLTEDGSCRVTLVCAVEDHGHNVTYRWIFLQNGAVTSQEGSHLTVSWRRDENQPNFTCIASNPVSNSTWQFPSGDICPGHERNTKLWIGLSLMVPILLCLGISSWCAWKQKRRRFSGSAAAFSSSQAEAPAHTPELTPGHQLYAMHSPRYQKLDTPPQTARQQPQPRSDSSSDSDETTEKEEEEEEEERTEMSKPVSSRDQVYDLVTQEDTGHDSASEEQAEDDLVTPGDRASASMVTGHTVYMQVNFNLQEKTAVPQNKENTTTIYCSIQKPQKVVPPQQNDPEFPGILTYENFT